MDRELQLIKFFCDADDFWKIFRPGWEGHLIENQEHVVHSSLAVSEIIAIVAFYHHSGFKTFKHYFILYLKPVLKKFFPSISSYSRFIELIKTVLIPIFFFLQTLLGECSGVSFIDSTPLQVCHNLRIKSHKTFKGIAKRGKSSIGWFFGFKLHIVINETGELLAWMLTSGNVSDRASVENLSKNLFGKLFGDRGYISSELFNKLFKSGVTLVTKIRSNMKNRLMSLVDKILLRKRGLVDSVNATLKEECNIEHSRHRSPLNFLIHLMGALIGYCYLEKKPAIRISRKNLGLLVAQ